MNRKVLVVDDDESVREGFEKILCDSGYDVDTAMSGGAAIQSLKKDSYDVAIVDLVLSDINGLQLIDKIRSFEQSTAIIVITGYPSSQSAAESFRKGAFDFLEKPCDREKLLTAIQKGLEKQKENEDRQALSHLGVYLPERWPHSRSVCPPEARLGLFPDDAQRRRRAPFPTHRL